MDHEGKLSITSTPTPPLPISRLFPHDLSLLLLIDPLPSWRIFVSAQRITPSQYTTHKTTNRAVYDSVRTALPKLMEGSIPLEVLLVNVNHQVMEGSITTPYFLRGNKWVTPSAAHGGNVGTTRRWALEKGLCVEEYVPGNSLVPGEFIWLSNGVRGWGWGYLEVQGFPDSSNVLSKGLYDTYLNSVQEILIRISLSYICIVYKFDKCHFISFLVARKILGNRHHIESSPNTRARSRKHCSF